MLFFPALSSNYWGRLFGSFSFFSASPDKILSGRVGHWQVLLDFLARWEPLARRFLGIGYKTLPYSTFAGATVIADNTFLSLLVETGVIGLAAFLAMNFVILKIGWKAMRSPRPQAAFFGEWIFCFWCGQIVQMLSGRSDHVLARLASSICGSWALLRARPESAHEGAVPRPVQANPAARNGAFATYSVK